MEKNKSVVKQYNNAKLWQIGFFSLNNCATNIAMFLMKMCIRDRLISARMAFDRENLRPLYRLEMGKTGDSCALYIAKRLGMPEDMIRTAASEAYGDGAVQEKSQKRPKEKSQKPPGRQWPGGLERIPVPGIVPIKRKPAAANPEEGYTRGDSVEVLPKGEIGIVVRPADQTGNVLVQVKKEKRLVNQRCV